MLQRTLSIGTCFVIILALVPSAQADEKAATDAIRKAGGSVRSIAKNVKSKEVALHLTDKDVTDEVLANLPQLPDVAWLNLRGTKITDAGLVHVGKLPALTHLHLELTGVGDAGLAHLKSLSNLEYLNLYGTQVSDAGLEHLKGLKKLKKLYLWQSKATKKGADAMTKAIPGIKVNTGADLSSLTKPAPGTAPPAKPVVPASKPPKKSIGKGQFVRVRLEGANKILVHPTKA